MFSSANKILLLTFIMSLVSFCGCCGNTTAVNLDTQPAASSTSPGAATAESRPSSNEITVSKPSPEAEKVTNMTSPTLEPETPTVESSPTPQPVSPVQEGAQADVISVDVNGEPGDYSFSVAIQSPDTGCDQYADWWEVVALEGDLVYRRILAHSHVGEQPFTRSGGPIAIEPDTQVIVRAHMNNSGYGGAVFLGSINSGFEAAELETDFAIELENTPPLPDGCGF